MARGPRGPYKAKTISTGSFDCKVIRVSRDQYLDKEVPRTISKLFRGNFYGKQSQWQNLDKNLVEHLYKCFQDRYQYEEQLDSKKARSVWENKAKKLCRSTWNVIRENCKRKTHSADPTNWKYRCPDFVDQEDWEGILESWMTPEWRQRSQIGTENRKRIPGVEASMGMYVRHTGGSSNFEIHLHQLEI